MTPKLTIEQVQALREHDGPLPVEDAQSHDIFFIVDRTTLDGLRADADRAAILEGIADMEAGRVVTLEELDARIFSKLDGRT